MTKKSLYEELVDQMYEGVYSVDIDRKIISWNEGAQRITGYAATEVVNRHCYSNILNHIDENGVALCFNGCPLHATIEDGKIREANVYLQHKLGHRIPVKVKSIPLYDEHDKITGSMELFTEIKSDQQLKTILEKYQKESSEDPLTGVPNRRYLEAIIESKIREYRAVGLEFGLAFLDIDNFKKINDTYGHETGDEVLKLLVKTIQSNLRKRDYIGRWGGEEFIVVFAEVNQEELALGTEKLRKLVQSSVVRLKDSEISITISMGATTILLTDTVLELVKRADDLMYNSKIKGRNQITIG